MNILIQCLCRHRFSLPRNEIAGQRTSKQFSAVFIPPAICEVFRCYAVLGVITLFFFFNLFLFKRRIIALQRCWSRPYNMNQPQVYLGPRPLGPPLPAIPHPQAVTEPQSGFPESHAGSHWLSALHMVVHALPRYSLHPPRPAPARGRKSVLCVCTSTAALRIGSSVPSFPIPYVCVKMRHVFFSF